MKCVSAKRSLYRLELIGFSDCKTVYDNETAKPKTKKTEPIPPPNRLTRLHGKAIHRGAF